MPLFSVIVPTFNRAALLAGTLESIFAQRFRDFEIIVVDDGSTDETLGYLQKFGTKVSVLQQPNRGAGAARNLGARYAQGKYLAFLDSDDLWFPWSLQIYSDVIQKHHSPSFIAGKPLRFSAHLDLSRVEFGATRDEWFVDFLASGDEMRWWGASSFVVRLDTFNAVGGFTEEWVVDEDTDLTLRLGVAPGFVQITAPTTFGYREHPSNVSKDQRRVLTGTLLRIRAEQEGQYPGGKARATERRRILTRHVRPVTLACIKQARMRDAWILYRATFWWHVSLGRVKFLFVFPILALASCRHWLRA
jgi:GT2 family glycosyltransferase